MTDIEVIITQPVIEVKFENNLNVEGGGAVDSVNGQTGDVVLTTSDIDEGSNQYFTEARVRATVLTGLSTATNSAIAATDSILMAFGKLQAQITALSSSLANYVTLATDQTITALKTFSNGFTLTPQATPTYARGRVYFDDTNDCLAFMDSVSGRSVQVGYEVLMLARNNTGVQINNGQVVYISGSTGTNSTVALASANAEATSMIIGVATHDIAINTVGKIVVFGLANDLDTSAFTDGQEVFLSAATAGAITTTPPASPNFVVRVGIVERAHPTQGKILVKPEITTANNNSLGTSQRVAPTQNSVKTYVDASIGARLPVEYPSTYSLVFDDFTSLPSLTASFTGLSAYTYISANLGTLGVASTKYTNAVGVYSLNTGTSTTGNSVMLGRYIFLGDGSIIVQSRCVLVNTSTLAQRFFYRHGLSNSVTEATTTDGIYFRCIDTENSGNFVCVCRAASVESVVNTAVAPSTTNLQNLRIEINAAGSSAQFFIDGVSVGTINTNLPANTVLLSHILSIQKTTGTTDRQLHTDYMYQLYTFTTAR